MPSQTGSFHSVGSPSLKIRISGVIPNSEREFEGIIDTGFTGFISMPMVQAFPLGLVLAGSTMVVLADNSKSARLTAIGLARLENGEEGAGLIILEWQQGDILIGMEFLRSLKKGLRVLPLSRSVELIDDAPPPSPPTAPVATPPPTVTPEVLTLSAPPAGSLKPSEHN